ncbi:helix-turn-helix domain-containing protein [Ruania rhizosphaerae]|uniref:helix-turn-helix domain-containing protein n=1 Tax=Ruania rhizosphaerae TaxID=1840413 RepID=UPI0013585BFE|nr:helix-turn-helix domain-containing protein [Ruania rhizosphaerae]
MTPVVGVVGPVDLAPGVAESVSEMAGLEAVTLPYSHESETSDIVRQNASSVDAWLFTGIVPYTLAKGSTSRPAAFVDYTRETVLRSWVRLAREGRDIARTSIDTVGIPELREIADAVDLPPDRPRSLPHRVDQRVSQLVDFHRSNPDDSWTAITCVSSVYEALREEISIIRLVPSENAIRTAISRLTLTINSQVSEDSQVAVGLLAADDMTRAAPFLKAQATALAGTVALAETGEMLLVTTRGALAIASYQFSQPPLLRRLSEAGISANAGFGVGRTALEAEQLARRALNRARTHPGPTAVVSFRNDVDLALGAGGKNSEVPGEQEAPALGTIATRVGVALQTLTRLRDLAHLHPDEPLTSRVVAEALDVQLRTARRMLQRLERGGYAERVGNEARESSGRPLTQYLLHL